MLHWPSTSLPLLLLLLFLPIVLAGSSSRSASSSNSQAIPLRQTARASVSVECKEPLMGSASWECAIGETATERSAFPGEGDGAWEDLGERHKQGEEQANGSGLKHGDEAVQAGQLELYHSHKVNRTNGRLFISAMLRWQFHSRLFHPAYQVQLRIQQVGSSNSTEGEAVAPTRLFSIPLVLLRNGTSNTQKVELIVRLDGLFQFGHAYHLQIISSLPEVEGNKSKTLATVEKRIHFAELLDEFDTSGCQSGQNGREGNASDGEVLKRRAMASRWTGALRTVTFFPLHSAINVTFFGAPPSHCFPGYHLQLWLMNAFQEQKTVLSNQLVREEDGIFVGHAEFFNLLRGDQRLQYRIKIVPIERAEDGTCLCQLEGKCGCVQVYSDPFPMANATAVNVPAEEVGANSSPPPPGNDSASSQSLLPLLLVCLFIGLTLFLLSFAFLLLILRNANRAGRKRRMLLIFRRREKEAEGLVGEGCRKSQLLARKEVQSVLLLNAQPAKRAEVERFARLLVKNGIRVFYDRWDRVSIERNLLLWVHQASTKADKAVLFWDRRAEQVLIPSKMALPSQFPLEMDQQDLFDRVFCALHQQLDPLKTVFVEWDGLEVEPAEGRPLGSLSENIFHFQRDLRLIYSALAVPVTEAELRELEQRLDRQSHCQLNRPESLVVVVPKMARKHTSEERDGLLESCGESSKNIGGNIVDVMDIPAGEEIPSSFDEQKVPVEVCGAGKNTEKEGVEPLDSGIETGIHF